MSTPTSLFQGLAKDLTVVQLTEILQGLLTVVDSTPPVTALSTADGVDASTSSRQLVGQSPGRVLIEIVNRSPSWAWLSFGGLDAISGSGIALAPNGGAYEQYTSDAVAVVLETGTGRIGYQEWGA